MEHTLSNRVPVQIEVPKIFQGLNLFNYFFRVRKQVPVQRQGDEKLEHFKIAFNILDSIVVRVEMTDTNVLADSDRKGVISTILIVLGKQ